MKKLKLDLDRIQVVSFSVGTKEGYGTVKGLEPDTDVTCDPASGYTELGQSCRLCLPASYPEAC